MRVVPVEQTPLESTQAEEVVLFLVVIDRAMMNAAAIAGIELVVRVVLFASDAVLAGIDARFDVAGVVTALQQRLDAEPVAQFGRPDEVVVADVQAPPRVLVERRDVIGERLWTLARRDGVLLHLEPVLVGAGQEVNRIAQQPMPTGHGIADDGRVGVA